VSKKVNLLRGWNGQSLIEVAIAVGVAVIIIGALVSLAVSATHSSRFARDHTQAAKLANEGLENVRRVRDSSASWSAFLTAAGGEETLGIFTRTTTVEEIEVGKKARATVAVAWTDSNGEHTVSLVSYFTNWQK